MKKAKVFLKEGEKKYKIKGKKEENEGKGRNLKAGKDNRKENSPLQWAFFLWRMTVWLNTNIYLVNRGQRT